MPRKSSNPPGETSRPDVVTHTSPDNERLLDLLTLLGSWEPLEIDFPDVDTGLIALDDPALLLSPD